MASTVLSTSTTSRLTPAARPAHDSGLDAVRMTSGPSAMPGSTKRRTDTIVARTAEVSSAMGSMVSRSSLAPAA